MLSPVSAPEEAEGELLTQRSLWVLQRGSLRCLAHRPPPRTLRASRAHGPVSGGVGMLSACVQEPSVLENSLGLLQLLSRCLSPVSPISPKGLAVLPWMGSVQQNQPVLCSHVGVWVEGSPMAIQDPGSSLLDTHSEK